MGKKITAFLLTALFIFMILYPGIILEGAKTGILLWFEAVLPSLLPYMIISNFVISAGLSGEIAFIMRPAAGLLRISSSSAYCILSGIFFGYPACAVSASRMFRNGEIDRDTASFCACAFNNISPAFIAGFLCTGILDSAAAIAPVLILFYSSVLLSAVIIRISLFKNLSKEPSARRASPKPPPGFADAAVMSALVNIAKLGGYIVIFSIVASVLSLIPWKYSCIFCGITEITTGIQRISEIFTDRGLLLTLVMPLLSFGGVSGIFQTFGVDTDGIIGRKKYFLSKLIAAGVSAALTFFAVDVLKCVG